MAISTDSGVVVTNLFAAVVAYAVVAAFVTVAGFGGVSVPALDAFVLGVVLPIDSKPPNQALSVAPTPSSLSLVVYAPLNRRALGRKSLVPESRIKKLLGLYRGRGCSGRWARSAFSASKHTSLKATSAG